MHLMHSVNLAIQIYPNQLWRNGRKGAPADEIKICLAGCWKANLQTASDRKDGFLLTLFEDVITIFTLGDGS